MKYYRTTSATRVSDGEDLGYRLEDVPESAKNSLAAMYLRTGVQLEFEHTHTITDHPVFRHATEDERAEGAPRIVTNTGKWTK